LFSGELEFFLLTKAGFLLDTRDKRDFLPSLGGKKNPTNFLHPPPTTTLPPLTCRLPESNKGHRTIPKESVFKSTNNKKQALHMYNAC
jgi:hypothetical protein